MSLLSELLRKERTERRMTQEELSKIAQVSRTTIAMYETGERQIPDDVLARIIKHLGSLELQAQKCWECEVNVFLLPLLDQVDRHPMTIRAKLIEEMQEAAAALEDMNLINKVSATCLSEAEKAKLGETLVQILDVIPAIQLFINAVAKNYQMPIDGLKNSMYSKCRSKGYHGNPNDLRTIKNAASRMR